MDWACDQLFPMRWYIQLKYHWWVDDDIIFRYQKVFFNIPKLLWYDISSCNITGRCMLASSLDIQKCFLILLKLTKLSPDQKMAQILYPSTYYLYYNI